MLFYTLPRLTDLFLFALDDARRAFELLLGIGDVVVVLADGLSNSSALADGASMDPPATSTSSKLLSVCFPSVYTPRISAPPRPWRRVSLACNPLVV